jgi:hypothetical protein
MRLGSCANALLAALMFIALLPGHSHAQKPSAIRELADGYRVERRLFIRALTVPNTDTMKFEYFEDRLATDSYAARLTNGMTFVTDRQRGLVLMLGFLNPVRYSWSTSVQTTDDPTYASAGKFLDALTAFAATGTGIGAAVNASAAAKPAAPGMGMFIATTASDVQIDVRSPVLLPYVVWLHTADVRKCSANAPAFTAFLSALVTADSALYAAPDDEVGATSRPANIFSASVKRTGALLRDPTTMAAMRAALDSSRRWESRLSELNANARKTLDGIARPAATYREGLAASENDFCQRFAPFTLATVGNFITEGMQRLTERERLVKTLTDLNTRLDLLTSRSDSNYFRVEEISVADGKISDVVLTVRRREPVAGAPDPFTFEDRKASLATFRVRPEQRVSMEFGLGVVALRTVEYPKFGTATVNGQTVVATAGADKQTTAPVALLNLVATMGRAPISPMLQFGVGSGESYPLLLFGGGMRFTRHAEEFSISGGVAIPFVRTLNNLAVGDAVSGTAALNQDITRTLGRRGFYLGIQRSLGGAQ